MTPLPLVSGVVVKEGRFENSLPVNLTHRVIETGMSKGELSTTLGAVAVGVGAGVDRGGFVWNGQQYRVMGTKLGSVSPDGSYTAFYELGGDGSVCTFAMGFDRVAIRSGERLFYFTGGTTVIDVTDPDLGKVLDVTWIDSYFVTTDGDYIAVSNLSDASAFDPLRYGAAESDPDKLVGVCSHREELLAIGRYSIQPFRNVGGNGFPFQAVKGAMIPFGAISAKAFCEIAGTFAFIGGAQGEPLGVFIGANGTASRVSGLDVERMLKEAGTDIEVEARLFGEEQHLMIHLPQQTVVLAMRASSEIGDGAWHVEESCGPYRPRHAVFWNDEHWVGDCASPKIGKLSRSAVAHFGQPMQWRFDAGMMFAGGNGLIAHEVELFGSFPRAPSVIFMSVTRDGEGWSREAARRLTGRQEERIVWRPNVRLPLLSGYRFRGNGRVAVSLCTVAAEPLT